MTWADFYLVCFLVGFGLSLLALLAGSTHIHLPGADVHHGIHVPHVHGPHVHVDLPWFNFGTIAAFLAWFGGTGYLLQHYYGVWFAVTLGVSTLSGIGAAAVVFWFLAKVLLPHERELTADETAVAGAVGLVSAAIRAGGTGEILYEQMGARRSVPARAETGGEIARGEEVFVVRHEHGIAYVRRWEDLPEVRG